MSDTDELLDEVDELTDDDVAGGSDPAAGVGGTATSGQGAATGQESTATGRSGGLRSRAADRAKSVFQPRAFLAATLLAAGGLFGANAIPVLSSLPVVGRAVGLLGVFLGTMVYGAVSSRRRYTESAAAGGLVAGLAAFQGMILLTLTGIGVPIVAVLAGMGALAGVVGHYFGRDLRAGVTGDLSGDAGP